MKEELIQKAWEAREKAYVPYSHFPVGAALLAGNTIYTGCNVENASYGLTICAERTAAVKAVSAGDKEFSLLAVVGHRQKPSTPCGACRQFLYEFNPNLQILLLHEGGHEEVMLKDLLPKAFGPKDL